MAQSRRILHTPLLPPPPPAASGLRPAGSRPPGGRPPGPPHAPPPSPGPERRRTTARAVTRRFLRCERGSVALESAIALSVLVGGFASLMNIVGDVFADDRTGRGARAVARAMALNPSADPWAALKREGGLSANAACPAWSATDTTAACGGWTLKIDRGVAPAGLPKNLSAGVSSRDDGELVLVRLERGGAVMFGLARSEPRG